MVIACPVTDDMLNKRKRQAVSYHKQQHAQCRPRQLRQPLAVDKLVTMSWLLELACLHAIQVRHGAPLLR